MTPRPSVFLSGLMSLCLAACATSSSPAPSSPPEPREPAGVIQGGGGGVFSAAIFWDEVRRAILPALTTDNFYARGLSAEELARVRAFMDPQMTTVSMTNEELDVRDPKTGKETRVDAVNLPSSREIRLFQPAWEYYFTHRMEIRHLILHEFLGLAGLSDVGYAVSAQYFKPRSRLVSFRSEEMICGASAWNLVWRDGRFTIENSYATKGDGKGFADLRGRFSEPRKKGTSVRSCTAFERLHGKCDERDLSRLVRTATVSAEYRSPLERMGSATKGPELGLQLIATLEGETFSFGWGAATGKRELNPPQISLLGRVNVRDSRQGRRTISFDEATFTEFSSALGDVMPYRLFNTEFFGALEKAGVPFEVDEATAAEGGGQGITQVQNLWNVMARFALNHGASEQSVDAVIRKEIFADAPDVIPIVMYGECSLR